MEIAFLSFAVVLTWLVHGKLSGIYRKKFASTRTLQFRLTHAIEIFMLTFVMALTYTKLVSTEPPTIVAISVAIATLIMLDGALLYFYKEARSMFDGLHFVTAYLAVAAAITLALSI